MTDVLARHLPWHRARLKFIARFTTALMKLTTTNLAKLALALKATVKPASSYRRIQRFMADFPLDYAVFGRFLLGLLPQRSEYVVIIDRTEWHVGQEPVNVLMIAVAYQGIAFPIVWEVLGREGSSSTADGTALPAELFFRVLPLGQTRLLRRRYLGRAAVDVVGERLADEEYLILATSTAAEEAFSLYRRRWEIETLFAALKSRGFDLEATHLSRPQRIGKLMGLLALAFVWSHLVGQQRARSEGAPAVKNHGYPARSLFRYGLDRLQSTLLNLHEQQAAFQRCIGVLSHPSQVLSCS